MIAMVKVIMGIKGAGKTKQMIDLANRAAQESKGVTVCLERGRKLTYDVNHDVRLVDTVPYDIRSYQVLRGFITGLYAGNYDIRDIFIDSLFKVSGNDNMQECAKFLRWCETFGADNGINFTVSISAERGAADLDMQKYLENAG